MADRDLIRRAIINAARNKRNRAEVQNVLKDIDKYVDILFDMIVNETFKPTPYRQFTVVDGISGKERLVSCPAFFPDQCLHWLVILATEEIFMKGMYEFVCGSIPKRGVHYGRKAVKKWMETDRPNTKYCAKLDITKFYPSINHDALKAALMKIGITGMTVSHVLGCGVQKGKPEYYRGVQVEANLLPKIQVDIVVSEVPVRKVIETAKKVLYTGHIGDGKIFVYDVENVVKVRTGEEGYAALQDVE